MLAEAVACRLRRATAPAGLFMGGGFDSSAICALAGPVVTAQGRKLIAVSSVMPEDYRGTIRHARRWCEMCRRTMPHLDVRYVTREGLDIFTVMEQSFLDRRQPPQPEPLCHARHVCARLPTPAHASSWTGTAATTRSIRADRTRSRACCAQGRLRRFVTEFKATRQHLRLSVKQTLVRHVLLQTRAGMSWMQIWKSPS